MSKKVIYSFEIDKDLKKQCEKICKNLGLDFSTALNIFVTRMVQNYGFPFRIEGNKLSKEAIKAVVDLESEIEQPESQSFEAYSDILVSKNTQDAKQV